MRVKLSPTILLTSFLAIGLHLCVAVSAAQTFRKENFDAKIQQLKSQAIGTCEKHGGINCAAGPTPSDGGVACLDGTKVKLNFADFCSRSKLTSTMYVTDKGGVQRRVSELRQFFMNGVAYPELAVLVRNSSPVKALKVRVFLQQGTKSISEAEGEQKDIDAFSGEEFKVPIPAELFLDRYGVGRAVLLSVTCDNC
jgi:hypothetical protein